MTVRELLEQGIRLLEQAGVEESASDAWILLEYVTGLDRAHYYMEMMSAVSVDKEQRYLELIKQRSGRVPVQQITNEAWFMGLSFFVNEHVLIPRLDTEVLVEKVLKTVRPGMRILDMCTGSGCILLSLLHEEESLKGVGADISPDALDVARRNSVQLGLDERAEFVRTDLFEAIPGDEKFDIIVSNPPYIRSDVIPGLMEEVRDHEPLLALDGHEDGLFFYRRIVREARCCLKPGGRLFFEIGFDQGDALRELLTEAGYKDVAITRDLAGLNRVAEGRM